jgi:hypothetical protein
MKKLIFEIKGKKMKITYLKKLALVGSIIALISSSSYADEGGVSVWIPGTYGSLAATAVEPGWSLPIIYYHTSVDASDSSDFEIGGEIRVGLDVGSDMLLAVPTYVFSDPVLGGQASINITALLARVDVSIDATLIGQNGGIQSGSQNDTLTSVGDLYPSASLRWNDGVHNTMLYAMISVPVGSYETGRLANIGLNHWALDGGGGYTYFNPETGREFSATVGFTYNFENTDTNYQSGIDAHLDWGASQFLSEQLHVGLVGYFYNQITADSGSGAKLDDFKSKVNGIGPQVGYIFNMGDKQAYLNLRAYWEFNANNRPEGYNSWLTLSIPL